MWVRWAEQVVCRGEAAAVVQSNVGIDIMPGTESILRSQLEGQHSTHVMFAKVTPAKRLPKWDGSPVQTEVASPSASDKALQSSMSLCYKT